MANYKPVKIMFDIDDEYHKKLYTHLKKQTNGSSYIRTLLHQDLNSGQAPMSPLIDTKPLNIINKSEQPLTDSKPSMKNNTVKAVTHNDDIKININNIQVEDLFIEDLI